MKSIHVSQTSQYAACRLPTLSCHPKAFELATCRDLTGQPNFQPSSDHSHAIPSYISPHSRSPSPERKRQRERGRARARETMMMSSGSDSGSGSGCGEGGDIGWEKRPGGMLVQTGRSDYVSPLPRLIRVRVSYGAARYDVSVASQATFGMLRSRVSCVQCLFSNWFPFLPSSARFPLRIYLIFRTK